MDNTFGVISQNNLPISRLQRMSPVVSGDWLDNNVTILSLLNCTLKNGYDGQFYVMCSLPQLEKLISPHFNRKHSFLFKFMNKYLFCWIV